MSDPLSVGAIGQVGAVQDTALLFARIALASAFLYSGVTKWIGWSDALEELREMGLPFRNVALAATIAVQLSGSAMLVTGLGFTFGALLLAGFTVAATLLGHPFWRFQGARFQRELTTTFEHLGLVGGLLLLASLGPGRIAL